MTRKLSIVLLMALMMVVVAACDGDQPSSTQVSSGNNSGVPRPSNAIDISIIYAPESEQYMPKVIEDFNRAMSQGQNPVTGQALASGQQPVYVTGEDGSSGTVMQGIVNAIIAPSNANVARPTIFGPSVSHWYALANYQSGRQLFDLSQAQATALRATRGTGAPETGAAWQRARELCGEQESKSLLFRILYGSFLFHQGNAARHRRVQQISFGFVVSGRQLGDRARVYGARLDYHRAGGQTVEDPVGSGVGCQHGSVIRQTRHDDLRRGGRRGGARGHLGADLIGHAARLVVRAVPYRQIEAGPGQSPGHGRPHSAHPDYGHLCHRPSLGEVGVRQTIAG